MDLFEGMLQKDRDEFRRVCNKLISMCFIIRRNEATKSEYYFILRTRDVFLRYLDVLRYTLEINEDYGVIQLVNRENYNHLNLKLNDSIILLILRILYDGKKRELSLTDVVVNLNAEQVLEECSIYKNPAWVMVKGCGRFWKGEKGASQVWLEDWTGGIGLSSRDIVSVRWDVDACPARIVTIENLTSFHRWQEDNTLAIYLGSYHNRVKRKFLQQVYEAYPKAVYLHFGDMDCGGILIWKDLCEKTGIPFLP